MELVNHIEIPEIGLGVYKMEAGAKTALRQLF